MWKMQRVLLGQEPGLKAPSEDVYTEEENGGDCDVRLRQM